jgi:hypothetical protein
MRPPTTRALAAHGIRTVRDGLRWHLIETAPGRYDWGSLLPGCAPRATRTPRRSGTSPTTAGRTTSTSGRPLRGRFARFAGEAARIVRAETDETPFYVP